MSMEQILELLNQKIPCKKDVDAGALYRAQRNEELEIITVTYTNRLTMASRGEIISGEFTALPYCPGGVYVVGTGLHRELQYPEICASRDADDRFTYLLNRLPPIYLRFFLGASYPADSNFSFTLDCAWLPSMLTDLLSARLTEEIGLFNGERALKHCCDFLMDDAIDFLFRSSPTAPLRIDLFQFLDINEASASAGGENPSYRLTDLLVGQEEQARNQEFIDALHECPVCFEEVPGTQCIRFRKCGHFACRECATASIVDQIEQGTNACEPTCISCAEPVRQQEIRAVVSNEQYLLYEKRLLNRTLSKMPDVVDCPARDCKFGHVLLTKNSDRGICPSCRFHFCVRCRAAFHGDTPCRTGPLKDLSPNEVAEIFTRYQQAGDDGRAQMEIQYGKANLIQLIKDHEANEYIKKACKRCPNCHLAIQHFGSIAYAILLNTYALKVADSLE
ncbi:unnamed protein product [Schistocephalus solidus]|uniref:RBR-type E3 ubiquitin transferase n=1 Tax=Schistocephalus solidus TaxID=70667 RepID=A0A183TFQ2_SCHSO|nr:unnamed protein product [Schistocephalus solidus]